MELQEKIKELGAPLDIDSLDFRVGHVSSYDNKKTGLTVKANLLVYKDARVDMQRLDEVVGPLNWKREHSRENKNCKVSIYNPELNEWVSKEDTGTESNTEAEKGLASDSFKRACTNWGIGRELYSYPDISIILKPEEYRENGTDRNNRKKYTTTGYFNPKKYTWLITVEEGKIELIGIDENGNERYNSRLKWQPNPNQNKPANTQQTQEPKQDPKPEDKRKLLPIGEVEKVGKWAKENGKDLAYLKANYKMSPPTENKLILILNA